MNTVRVQFLEEYRELFSPKWRYFAYWGGRASGKSYQVALSLILRSRLAQMKVLCTRQIQASIKDSVHSLLKTIIDQYGFNDFEVTDKEIRNTITGSEFIFKGLYRNVNEIKSTDGVDVAWVEEAQSVTEESLDILTPTVRKPGSQIIFTFNRFTELDPVFVRYVMHKPKNCFEKKVNSDVLEAVGLLSDEIIAEREHDRVNDPELYAHKWLGEPISQSENAAISRTKVIRAMEREVPDEGQTEVGVDVARMGNDRTVFWMRKGMKTIRYEVYTKKRTTEVCDLLELFVDVDKSLPIKIDDTGVGGGITDEMIRRGYNAIPVNFGAEASDKDKYPNLISEAWFYMDSILDDVQLPQNNDLLMEMSSRLWRVDSKGRRSIESKDDYKKRGYRSPDLVDACILAYYTPNVAGESWLQYYQGGV